MMERKPAWLKVKIPHGANYQYIKALTEHYQLHTVCESAACPNLGECWERRTATFMILGNVCTRRCGFCAVTTGEPRGLDLTEPERVAEAVAKLGIKYAVITSVTRDDLEDGGAEIFSATIWTIRAAAPDCRVEVLIPDFQNSEPALNKVIGASPDVLGHNLETVPRLYSTVRPQADYSRSLELLRRAKNQDMVTKSGLMLGLGENLAEVLETMNDLRQVDCDLLTLGQYLQPDRSHLLVIRYYHPDEFAFLKDVGANMGFKGIEAGPLVRSSYFAERQAENLRKSPAKIIDIL